MIKNFFAITTLTLIAGYSIYLYFTNQLGLYIHPRFFEEALIAGMFGLVISILYLFTLRKQNKIIIPIEIILVVFVLLGLTINLIFLVFGFFFLVKYPNKESFSVSSVITIGFLGLMILIPPTSLSSFTASQRVTDLTNLNLTNQNRKLVNAFTNNTESLGLGDWIASFTYNPDNEYYVGKKVKVSGFMFKTEDITNDDFVVARFAIACCAVDARPIGLKVNNVNQFSYEKDRWVEVTGTFIEDGIELKIQPTEIKFIDQPDQPYIF